MFRARAPSGDRVARPGTPRGAAWLSWLALGLALGASSSGAGCSLSGEGTGHTENASPSLPVDDHDSAVDEPGAARDAGLDARAPSDDANLDALVPSTKLDAKVDAALRASDAALADSDADADAPDVAAPDAEVSDAAVIDPGPDAGPTAAGASDAGVLDTGLADAGPAECALAGAYGLRFDFQVVWEGTSLEGVIPVIAPGKGVPTIFASLDLRPDAPQKKGEATLAPCGAVIPDFAAGNNIYKGEQYSVYIPDASWDSPQMPRWSLRWNAACAQPGCAFSSSPLLALLGARSEPAVPPSTEATLELADHDGDGQPSVTLLTRGPSSIAPSGKPYSYPPLLAPWARTRKMMLAIGVSGKIDGALGGCGAIGGGLTQGVIEQGAVACTGVVDANGNGTGTEQNCSSDFVNFLDENMPHWTVSSASFRAERMPNPTCATVRSALR